MSRSFSDVRSSHGQSLSYTPPPQAMHGQASSPSSASSSSPSTFPAHWLSQYSGPVLAVAAFTAISLSAYYAYRQYRRSASSARSASSSSPPPTTITAASPLLIGTRTSQLALWQATHVSSLLCQHHPALSVRVTGMNTTGDVDQIKPLTEFGNKGVFTKELDVALLARQIRCAVHCVKDLPTTLPDGLLLAAVLQRGDVEDTLVVSERHRGRYASLAELPAGAVVGTSALRRRAALAARFPHLVLVDCRGNINTRLMKLDRGDFDAIVIAQVGLQRLGFHHRITQVLQAQQFGYAVGQGALGILTREESEAAHGQQQMRQKQRTATAPAPSIHADWLHAVLSLRSDLEVRELLQPLEEQKTRLEVEAERSLLRALHGGCKVPITVRSSWSGSLQPPLTLPALKERQHAPAASSYAAGTDTQPRLPSLAADLLLSWIACCCQAAVERG